MLFEYLRELEKTADRFSPDPGSAARTIEARLRTSRARAQEVAAGWKCVGKVSACHILVDAACNPLPGLLLPVSLD